MEVIGRQNPTNVREWYQNDDNYGCKFLPPPTTTCSLNIVCVGC